ncbi:uncharacterized protein LOC143079986 isoform X2 [Mytilus galloprovincialis]|uniref:uncharacterized protein LOC143079986 isoform X2 n=1 Tax=Mytilus galloprovincialis TaxID=29158 RepID=UPI003F7C2CF5
MASILLFAALYFLTADGSEAMSLAPLTTTTSSNCVDATFVNCKDSHVCSDTNLRKYCPVTCGVCRYKTYSCHDDHVFNCNKNVCGFPSLKKFCPVTCGTCGYGAGSGPGGTGMVNNSNCMDLGSNCKEYPRTFCHEPYVGWAEHHCPKYCNFCVSNTGSKTNSSVIVTGYGGPGPGGTGIPNNGNCTDLVSNCNAFDLSVCREPYLDWAKNHCPKYCDLCGSVGSVGSTGSYTNTNVGTVATVTCEDRISSCKQYGRYACLDPYADWAKHNCAKTCRFCAQLAP